MSKYILVYELNDFPENGGGTQAEDFEKVDKMHERVNELGRIHKDLFSITYAGFLQTEYKYDAVSIITEYKPQRI